MARLTRLLQSPGADRVSVCIDHLDQASVLRLPLVLMVPSCCRLPDVLTQIRSISVA